MRGVRTSQAKKKAKESASACFSSEAGPVLPKAYLIVVRKLNVAKCNYGQSTAQ